MICSWLSSQRLLDFFSQDTSSRIAKDIREDLVKQISVKARVVAGGQESKRRDLAVKMQARVSGYEAGISRTAQRWNTVRRYRLQKLKNVLLD